MKTILLLNLLWLVAVLASSPEENLNVETRGGEELFEGDMKFAPGQARGSVPGRLWPGGVFVYDIESSLSDEPNAMSAINNAMQDWKDNTCIKFRKRRVDETAYVSFFKGGGCWSYVGRIGREQQLSLAAGCWHKGTVIHEIGHALGFLHEQSRPDRDTYVEIKFENIQSGMEGNFQISSSVNSLGTTYDYGSIMHYGARYFSKNGQPTIVPKQAGVTIGQRSGLSPTDIMQMKLLYECSGSQPNPSTLPPPSPGSFGCNFDNDICGFEQNQGDDFDWTRRRGPTPSTRTGPSSDKTSGQGYYTYIETSYPRLQGEVAKISRTVTLSGASCLMFYYHMYGSTMGRLRVTLSDIEIFMRSGDQGNQWLMFQQRLEGTGTRVLTFEGTRGSSYRGDAAIDDIVIYDC